MSGSLRWGVKRSLHEYVRSSEGVVEVGDGAVLDGDEILFPEDADGGYRGSVRFLAHAGMLDWRFSAPRIEAEGAQLTIRRRDGARVVIATIGGGEVRLAIDGSLLFDGFYSSGTVLDPIGVISGRARG